MYEKIVKQRLVEVVSHFLNFAECNHVENVNEHLVKILVKRLSIVTNWLTLERCRCAQFFLDLQEYRDMDRERDLQSHIFLFSHPPDVEVEN